MGKKRAQTNINFPREVQRCWDDIRVGYPNTMFAMAGLAAYSLLQPTQRQELMNLIGAVDEGRADWSQVQEWCIRQAATQPAPPPALPRAEIAAADAVVDDVLAQEPAGPPAGPKKSRKKPAKKAQRRSGQ